MKKIWCWQMNNLQNERDIYYIHTHIHILNIAYNMYFVYFSFIKRALNFMHSNIYKMWVLMREKKCALKTLKSQFMWQTHFTETYTCMYGLVCGEILGSLTSILFLHFIFPYFSVFKHQKLRVYFRFSTLVLWNQDIRNMYGTPKHNWISIEIITWEWKQQKLT